MLIYQRVSSNFQLPNNLMQQSNHKSSSTVTVIRPEGATSCVDVWRHQPLNCPSTAIPQTTERAFRKSSHVASRKKPMKVTPESSPEDLVLQSSDSEGDQCLRTRHRRRKAGVCRVPGPVLKDHCAARKTLTTKMQTNDLRSQMPFLGELSDRDPIRSTMHLWSRRNQR